MALHRHQSQCNLFLNLDELPGILQIIETLLMELLHHPQHVLYSGLVFLHQGENVLQLVVYLGEAVEVPRVGFDTGNHCC